MAVELLNHDAVETGARLQFMKYLADEDLEIAIEMVENFLEKAIHTTEMKARQIAQVMISRAVEMTQEVNQAQIEKVRFISTPKQLTEEYGKPVAHLDSAMGG